MDETKGASEGARVKDMEMKKGGGVRQLESIREEREFK